MPQTLERRRKYVGVILSDEHTLTDDWNLRFLIGKQLNIICMEIYLGQLFL